MIDNLKQMDIGTLRNQPWYALTDEKVKQLLQTDEKEGLSKSEVEQRHQQFGLNKLPEKKQTSLMGVLLRQFKDPLIYILLIAGIVSLIIGNINNAIFIFAVLVINAGIGTFQEWKAENSAQALQSVMKIRATVRREGQQQTLDITLICRLWNY
jgi:P-type Ca2+ transporter type 2C